MHLFLSELQNPNLDYSNHNLLSETAASWHWSQTAALKLQKHASPEIKHHLKKLLSDADHQNSRWLQVLLPQNIRGTLVLPTPSETRIQKGRLSAPTHIAVYMDQLLDRMATMATRGTAMKATPHTSELTS